MDTVHIRVTPRTLERVDALRARLTADAASLGNDMRRSVVLRAALERGLVELESSHPPPSSKRTGTPARRAR